MWGKIIDFLKFLFNFFFSSRQSISSSISSRTPVSSRSREDVSVPMSAPSAPTELLTKKSSFVEVSPSNFSFSKKLKFSFCFTWICFIFLFRLFCFVFLWHLTIMLYDYFLVPYKMIHFQRPATHSKTHRSLHLNYCTVVVQIDLVV